MELQDLKIGLKFKLGNKRYTIVHVGKYITVMNNKGQTSLPFTVEEALVVIEQYYKSTEKSVKPLKKSWVTVDGVSKTSHKGMTSQQASAKKIGGHDSEYDFAEIVDGKVIGGHEKADVRREYNDREYKFSVKAADKKIQGSLYTRSRYEKNDFGELSPLFTACIDAFPLQRSQHLLDKSIGKSKLSIAMRELRLALEDKNTLDFFLYESLFGKSADYISMRETENSNRWHIFPYKIVAEEMSDFIEVENSKSRRLGEMDNQKVIFKAKLGRTSKQWITVGEIEMRNDSDVHYREIKFWMNMHLLLELLQKICANEEKLEILRDGHIIVLYSNAVAELEFLNQIEKETNL